MGNTTPVVTKINTPSYQKLVIETADGYRYESDLSSLSKVYCFPKNAADWKRCSIDTYGLGIIWSSRFEVHVDQVIGLATQTKKLARVG